MAQPDIDWPVWITAGATVITAILTGTGGVAAWLALRREREREMPVVERSLYWDKGHLILKLTVTNRLPETLTLDSVEIKRPRGTTISDETGPGDKEWNPGPPIPGESSIMVCGHPVKRAGSVASQHSFGDTSYWGFSVWPPASWKAGVVKIVLRISSRAETIRNRRIVIKSKVPAAPKSITEDSAKSAD